MKNHFDISGSIEIREVDIAGVACTCQKPITTLKHEIKMHINDKMFRTTLLAVTTEL